MAKRNYFNGLITGGFLGSVLGAIFTSRQKPSRKLLGKSHQIGDNAKRVLRGISRGMLEMKRR